MGTPADRPDSGVLNGPHTGPTVPKMLLGAQLRRLREERGISRDRAGAAIGVPASAIERLELGRGSFGPRDVAGLCTLYEVTDQAERATLLELAGRPGACGWWREYREVVPDWLEPYLGLEQAATMIRTYEVQFVPGLLQTPGYARAVIGFGHGRAGGAEVERRVELRVRRQRILHRPGPARLWAVIDEAALRRPVGGPAVMYVQVQRLLDLCDLPNVTLQVLPLRAGGTAALGGPITVLRLPALGLPDVVYLEQPATGVYPDRAEDLDHYRHLMNLLVTDAEPPRATPSLLGRILREL